MPPVTLRRADPNHAVLIHSWRSEPSATRFQPLRPYTVDQLRAILRDRRVEPLDRTLRGKVQWVILDEDRPAGWITVDVTDREHGIASVGYTLSEAFRGHGLATEAVVKTAHLALDPNGLDLWRLEANVATANIASRRVLERAGFTHEGCARALLIIAGERIDHERYALLRTDLDHSRAAAGQP